MALELLILNLDEQIRVYRHLLEIVRKEKDILISANLDDLNENNRSKEAMLVKIRALEQERIHFAKEVCEELGIDSTSPRLLDIALHLDSEKAEKLRNLHSVLDLHLKRVQELNKKNEVLVQSALANITGAMNNLKNVLDDKKTYKRKGEKDTKNSSQLSGQLVRKNV